MGHWRAGEDGSDPFDLDIPNSEKEGYYYIDYREGLLYTFTAIQGPGNLFVEYNYTNYYVEYNIAAKVSPDNYVVDSETPTITLQDKYIVKTFSNSLSSTINRSLFRVAYDYIEEIQQNPKELEPYFTPVVTDYKIAVITKENF